jgi:hypothetical protein
MSFCWKNVPFQIHLSTSTLAKPVRKIAKRDMQLSLENVTAPTCWISCLYFAERSPAIFDPLPQPSTVPQVRFRFYSLPSRTDPPFMWICLDSQYNKLIQKSEVLSRFLWKKRRKRLTKTVVGKAAIGSSSARVLRLDFHTFVLSTT